jgi:hypothetical protein
MALALEVLRADDGELDMVDFVDTLDWGGDVAIATGRAVMRALRYLRRRDRRLLRARLALYLRAVLRAGAGDYGWLRSSAYECCVCGERVYVSQADTLEELHAHMTGPCAPSRGVAPMRYARDMRILWELAPPHTGTTSRERREAHHAAE